MISLEVSTVCFLLIFLSIPGLYKDFTLFKFICLPPIAIAPVLLSYILMIFIYKHVRIHIHLCMYVCVYVYIQIHICVHTHFRLHKTFLFRTVNIHLDLLSGLYFQNLSILLHYCASTL